MDTLDQVRDEADGEIVLVSNSVYRVHHRRLVFRGAKLSFRWWLSVEVLKSGCRRVRGISGLVYGDEEETERILRR